VRCPRFPHVEGAQLCFGGEWGVVVGGGGEDVSAQHLPRV